MLKKWTARIAGALALLAACVCLAYAVNPITVDRGVASISGQRVPAGYEQLSLSTGSATALAAVPASAPPNVPVTLAVICVETISVRFRDDGTDPTASVGMPIPAGGCYTYTGNPSNLRFIRQSASTSTVNVLYYY